MVQRLLQSGIAGLLCVAWLSGCRAPHRARTGDFVSVNSSLVTSREGVVDRQAFVNPVVSEIAGPHPVDDYIRFALMQNPRIQAARMTVESRANRVPQAASLADPTLNVMGWPSIPHAPQYVNGRMTSDLSVAQMVPWYGTLQAQAAAAEHDTDVARAQLAAAELDVIQNVKKAYYELYFVERALQITITEQKSVSQFVELAETKFRAAKASEQDVLRAQLEVSSVNTELIRLRQQLASAKATLNRLLHVSPDTDVRAIPQLPAESLPDDLHQLYALAVQARPELHAALSAIQRDREKVELAHLKYFPDMTVSTGWSDMTTNGAMSPLADGRGNWNLGLMVNIPIYQKRLDAAVREAETMVIAGAREYDALRDEVLEAIKDQFAQAQSQQEMLKLFQDDIVPKADQTLEVSIRAYEVGEVDFQQLIDNWRQVLRFQLARERLEAQYRQSLSMLDRAVGRLYDKSAGAEAGSVGDEPQPPTPDKEPPSDLKIEHDK